MTTFRCHDADACAFGQKPCPTPRACGCKAPKVTSRAEHLAAYLGENGKESQILATELLARQAEVAALRHALKEVYDWMAAVSSGKLELGVEDCQFFTTCVIGPLLSTDCRSGG